jgi:hypothetical protein
LQKTCPKQFDNLTAQFDNLTASDVSTTFTNRLATIGISASVDTVVILTRICWRSR